MSVSEALDSFKACPIFEVLYSEGDELPEMAGVFKNVNLTGHTVRLKLQRPTDVLTKDATLIDPTNGIFKFAWDATDLVKGFGQLALIQIIDPSTKTASLARFQLDIHEVPA